MVRPLYWLRAVDSRPAGVVGLGAIFAAPLPIWWLVLLDVSAS
ncbi:MAG: hypothetical protein AAGM22_20025 [Acidobacteriota bacterium]